MAKVTAQDIATLIDQIAEDKATKLKALNKALVVMVLPPEWVRTEEVSALFGLPPNQLHALARKGEIIARKSDPMNRNSATLYKVESIRKVIDQMMPYDVWAEERPDLKMAAGE
jgi:hypothetical protein